MGTIVAIGGGDIRKKETLRIDQEIVRLSGKKKPRFLFIPTASSDDENYSRKACRYFEQLGCECDVLLLIKKKNSPKEIQEKIWRADIIYVGGGNTLKMMRLWRRLGVDMLLKKAWKSGKVLCGKSAGSICWFEFGHSDSLSYYNPRHWTYICVRGLGFLKGIHCPHYDSHTRGRKRKQDFEVMIQHTGGRGIALDNGAALEVIGKKYKVLSSKKGAKVYVVYRKGRNVVSEEIVLRKEFRPLQELYS